MGIRYPNGPGISGSKRCDDHRGLHSRPKPRWGSSAKSCRQPGNRSRRVISMNRIYENDFRLLSIRLVTMSLQGVVLVIKAIDSVSCALCYTEVMKFYTELDIIGSAAREKERPSQWLLRSQDRKKESPVQLYTIRLIATFALVILVAPLAAAHVDQIPKGTEEESRCIV